MFMVLRKRNFLLLWSGQFVSLCGDWLLFIALPFYIYQLTGSVVQLGISLLVELLPRILLGSVAGVFVDRWDRRWTMIVADILRAAVLLVMLLVHTASLLWVIYIALAVQAIVSQFFTPASMALIPKLVEEDKLIEANSLASFSEAATRLVGPPVGGFLFAILGMTGIVIADSLTYVFSALMILLIALPARTAEKLAAKESVTATSAMKRVWNEWTGGLQLLRKDRILSGLFSTMAVMMIGQGIINVIIVVFIKNVLHGGTELFGWVITAQGIGSLLGAVLVGAISKTVRPVYLVAWGLLTAGIAIVVVTNYPQPILMLVLIALVGVFIAGCMVTVDTLLQTSVEDHYRGRVFGTFGTISSLAMLIGMILSSGLGDSLGPVPLMNIAGALTLLSGIVALFTLHKARLLQPEHEAEHSEQKLAAQPELEVSQP